ncbi:MAG: serine/threonine protein kinase [Deltaproteobacteria bacterium]|nr:serine/threonine protein kinase [Deltaproteobacteria bacterium]MDQ3296682.1 serine/threonine protein kinase [Myxococcota bacterium]
MSEAPQSSTVDVRKPPRLVARSLASPAGVLVILPALVLASGVVVLLLGRSATRETAETMARHQLVAQAKAVEHDVAFALAQADPVLATMRTLANAAMPPSDALIRLRDAVLGRPAVYNATIAFPSGVMWGAFFDDARVPHVLESRMGDTGTVRTSYTVKNGALVKVSARTDSYDARKRPYYEAAIDARQRVWLPPRVFSASGKTGLTVTEPVYGPDQTLVAVISIDFDVAELSAFLREAPLAGARTVMFTADGTILASSSAAVPRAALEKRLLHHADFGDAALTALFATDEVARLRLRASDGFASIEPRFLHVAAPDGDYLASIAVVGGHRVGTPGALEWYLATLVPESSLLGAMHRLDRTSIIASLIALAIAMAVALVFAWNLVRMRRAVGAARAEARTAVAHAKQLGSYRLVERLGIGGMGEVWRAEHQLLARRAAIKLVRNDLATDPAHGRHIKERFRREAQTLASMRSRHTIELYDYGVTNDGTFFYVMELLDGLDLARLVDAHGPLPAARVIKILTQACQSLAEAHAAGLLHRDIKPANLVLCVAADEVDIIKVLDFGIVHHVAEIVSREIAPREPLASEPPPVTAMPADSNSRLTIEGTVVGTPGYIAPEQASSGPLDPRGDVYSLGCVAWFLLTGTEVYGGATAVEVVRAHIHQPIPPLRPLVQGWLPVDLAVLIECCLAKHPINRPGARELATALRDIEIPAEHAWTEQHAASWWAEQRVGIPAVEAEVISDNSRVVVVQHELAAMPEAQTGSNAKTVVVRSISVTPDPD